MSVLATDFLKGFDPTGSSTLSAAQLLQMINSATPNTDKGLVIVTADSGGSPDVPDAATTTKWQKYLWLRVVTATSTFTLYAWNPNVGSDATYLKWKDTYSGTIPAGTITNDMLAGSIAASKLAGSIALSQITNGTNLLSTTTSFATGDVTGTQSGGLNIGAKKVLYTMLANDASVDANRAVTTDSIKTGAVTLAKFDTTGAADTFLNNTVLNTPVWATKRSIIKSASPVVTTTGNILKVPQVATEAASDGGTWQMTDPVTFGRVLKVASKKATYISSSTVIPLDNTIPQITEGAEIVNFAFTPSSASSILRIVFNTYVGCNIANVVVALFSGASDALQATTAYTSGTLGRGAAVNLDYIYASPGTTAITFSVRFGPATAGTAYAVGCDSTATFSTASASFITIQEILGTVS